MKPRILNTLLIPLSILTTFTLIETASLVAIRFLESDSASPVVKNRLEIVEITAEGDRRAAETSIPKQADIAKTHTEYRMSKPDPYKDSTYYEWFAKESWSSKSPECRTEITHDGNGFDLRYKDTEGCRGVTIKDGWRVTSNQPQAAEKNIYIYGGSTVEGSEVPNSLTIASHLQKLLNDLGYLYKVHNRGFTTVVTSQQLDFLKASDIHQNDIVVFYDGGNDQWQSVANKSPGGTIIGTNRKLIQLARIKSLIARLQSYQLALLLGTKKTELDKRSLCGLDMANELLMRANVGFDFYISNLLSAKSFVESRGASFVHFMQPHLFANKKEDRTDYERSLINSTPSEMVPTCAEEFLTAGSQVFSKRHSEILRAGVNSVDLSGIFAKDDPRRPKGEHFLDWIHITEKGNHAIALEIYKSLHKSQILTWRH